MRWVDSDEIQSRVQNDVNVDAAAENAVQTSWARQLQAAFN